MSEILKPDLCVIGARPAVGKSALAAQLADELASKGVRTLIFSYEMSGEDYVRRFIQRRSGMTREQQDDGLSNDEADYVRSQTKGEWSKYLTIDDTCPSHQQSGANASAKKTGGRTRGSSARSFAIVSAG